MVICLERGADLHMAQLMPLPLTVCCFSKIQIGFTFLVLAHLGSPGKGPLNWCVCVCGSGARSGRSWSGGGVIEIAMSGERVFRCSRSTHTLWSQPITGSWCQTISTALLQSVS